MPDYQAVRPIHQIVKEVKGYFPDKQDFSVAEKLTIFEIATQIQRNEILQAGLVVSSSDSNPSGLEAIAIAMGYSKLKG